MYDIYVRLDISDQNDKENKPLWVPGLEDNNYILYSAILELQLNHSGKLTFQMSPKHPFYNDIKKRKTRVIVRKNGVTYWTGRVIETKTDFYKRRNVVCEGALSYLLDVLYWDVRNLESFKDSIMDFGGSEYVTQTLRDYIDSILWDYNNYKMYFQSTIHLGNITAVDPDYEITRKLSLSSDSVPTVLDVLNAEFIEQYGGYFKIRHEDDELYLDYLNNSGELINQQIRFGKNLLDLEDYITTENICTRIYPLGATNREVIEYRKAVHGYNDTETPEMFYNTRVGHGKAKRLEESSALDELGVVEKCVIFDKIYDEEELQTVAEEWIKNYTYLTSSITINALDLSLLMEDVDSIDCGSSVEIISEPHGVDMQMVCSSLTINILSPSDNRYVFGAGINSMSDRQATVSKQSSKAYNVATHANGSAANADAKAGELYIKSSDLEGKLLPEATSIDNGKMLVVSNGKWIKTKVTIRLPEVTSEDNGKILKVVDGKWATSEMYTTEENDSGGVTYIIGG